MAESKAVRTTIPQVPYQDKIAETTGYSSKPWQDFFRGIWDRLIPLGIEQSFDITAGLPGPVDVIGLNFDFMNEQFMIIDVVFQRVSTESSVGAGNGQELIEPATFYIWYKPRAKTWQISKLSVPGTTSSNTTLTITNAGRVQYAATALTGLPDVDKITWRVRKLKARIAKAQGPWV